MDNVKQMTRRSFLAGSASLGALALAGCSANSQRANGVFAPNNSNYAAIYGPVRAEPYPVPGIKLERVPRRFYRQRVRYATTEAPGTIVVDTANYYLYLVEGGGEAMRYGVGLGRQGFEWSGRAVVKYKKEWPTWTPPETMIAREPDLVRYSAANGGMPPGPENPLGARALYIFQGNVDTLYRIHGSPEYWTIGKSVSSGCVRMMQQDVIDLYQRVPNGTPIVVV
ncbi:MAG: L,D-transpeptidase family protein [Rhodomicrobiaceae bacterium]